MYQKYILIYRVSVMHHHFVCSIAKMLKVADFKIIRQMGRQSPG
jgi:hypothetical protein